MHRMAYWGTTEWCVINTKGWEEGVGVSVLGLGFWEYHGERERSVLGFEILEPTKDT